MASSQTPGLPPKTLLIACGALAREALALIEINDWRHMDITCLPAVWHNHPERIPDGMRRKIHDNRDAYDRILALYGDCGTGGMLDAVLKEEGVERIPGAHCYEFFTGSKEFAEIAEREPGTFYLTDYLARHFDTLIMGGLGIDRHPELLDMYFGNYTRLLYMAQIEDTSLQEQAKAAAEKLGLRYEYIFTGLNGLGQYMVPPKDNGPGAGV